MDNRANIKIEFEVFGEEFKTEMSINYSVDSDYGGIDDRVLRFFEESYNIAKAKDNLKSLEIKYG